MPISKTPRKVSEEFQNPVAQMFEDVDSEDVKKVDDNRIEELENALRELREKHEDERSDFQLTQPAPQWQSQVTQDVEINPDTIKLPDPALDPDGYASAVQKRVELVAENARKRRERDERFAKDIDDKTNELWADFGEEFPEYTDREKIDYAATKVVQAAVKKGLDINRYMFGPGRSRFMKDVAKKFDSVFGEPEADDEDDFENTRRTFGSKARATSRNRTAARLRLEDDEGRSAGVFGGNESGGRPNARTLDVEEGPSMVDDIHAMQKKTGFW